MIIKNLKLKIFLSFILFVFFSWSLVSASEYKDTNSSSSLDLKTSKENIVNSEIYENNQKNKLVKYSYKTNQVSRDINEDISKRTEVSQTFPLGENKYKTKFFSSPQFIKENDKWFQLEYATTTLEAWNDQTLTLWDDLKLLVAQAADTFYPSSDGSIYTVENSNWDTVHNAASGSGVNVSAAGGYVFVKSESGPIYQIYSYFLNFDTSNLADDITITDLTANFYGADKTGTGKTYGLYLSTASTNIVKEDFDLRSNTAASDTAISITNWSTAGYNTFEGNAAGIAAVSLDGLTKFCLRNVENDVGDSAPAAAANFIVSYESAETGTAKDPYLEITYSAVEPPVTPPATATSTGTSLNYLEFPLMLILFTAFFLLIGIFGSRIMKWLLNILDQRY